MTDDTFDFGRFEALTFDCYGTLIDWETGLTEAFREILEPSGRMPERDGLLETYAGFEAEGERPPYRRYRQVLADAARATCATLGVAPTEAELDRFGGSVVDWPAFPTHATHSAGSRPDSGSAFSPTAMTTCSSLRTRGSASSSTGS